MAKKYNSLLKTEKVYKTMPKGWKHLKGSMTAPNGYIWIYNGYTSFDKRRKKALLQLKSNQLKSNTMAKKRKTKVGLKVDGTLKKGYRYEKGGRIVKVKKK